MGKPEGADTAVEDERVCDPRLLRRKLHILAARRAFGCLGKYRKSAVLFKDRVFDIVDIRVTCEADLGDQLFETHPDLEKLTAVELAALDHDARRTVKKPAEKVALGHNEGIDDLETDQRQDRNDRVGERFVAVKDRIGSKLGKKKGGDKLGKLELADLPFAHQTHDDDQKQINEYRAEKNQKHRKTPRFYYCRGRKKKK